MCSSWRLLLLPSSDKVTWNVSSRVSASRATFWSTSRTLSNASCRRTSSRNLRHDTPFANLNRSWISMIFFKEYCTFQLPCPIYLPRQNVTMRISCHTESTVELRHLAYTKDWRANHPGCDKSTIWFTDCYCHIQANLTPAGNRRYHLSGNVFGPSPSILNGVSRNSCPYANEQCTLRKPYIAPDRYFFFSLPAILTMTSLSALLSSRVTVSRKIC